VRQGDREFAPAGGFSARHAVTTNPVENLAKIARVVSGLSTSQTIVHALLGCYVGLIDCLKRIHRKMPGFRRNA
jgi:hypothetical protein